MVEDDPSTYKEVMASRNSSSRNDVIQDEIDSIMSNHTQELVDLPKGSRLVGCQWVFRRKYHCDGTPNIYKYRIVTKGFRQKEDVNYFDIYALEANTKKIKFSFALALLYDLIVHQIDVKTTFPNGDIDEKIYMEQP